jgi:hypothetical protein
LEKKRIKDSLAERVSCNKKTVIALCRHQHYNLTNVLFRLKISHPHLRYLHILLSTGSIIVDAKKQKKRELNKEISNQRASLKNAKAKDVEVKKLLGKQSISEALIRRLENVFKHHCISKPHYHGGK